MTYVFRNIKFQSYVPGLPKSSGSKSQQNYQTKIKNYVRKDINTCFEGNLTLVLDVFYTHISNIPDADNLSKPLLDALKGVIYLDDKQVEHLQIRMHNLNQVVGIKGEPSCILEPLINNIEEYVYIRVY